MFIMNILALLIPLFVAKVFAGIHDKDEIKLITNAAEESLGEKNLDPKYKHLATALAEELLTQYNVNKLQWPMPVANSMDCTLRGFNCFLVPIEKKTNNSTTGLKEYMEANLTGSGIKQFGVAAFQYEESFLVAREHLCALVVVITGSPLLDKAQEMYTNFRQTKPKKENGDNTQISSTTIPMQISPFATYKMLTFIENCADILHTIERKQALATGEKGEYLFISTLNIKDGLDKIDEEQWNSLSKTQDSNAAYGIGCYENYLIICVDNRRDRGEIEGSDLNTKFNLPVTNIKEINAEPNNKAASAIQTGSSPVTTVTPTVTQTDTPTDPPIDAPTDTPIDAPTDTPTDAPTDTQTDTPTDPPADATTDNKPHIMENGLPGRHLGTSSPDKHEQERDVKEEEDDEENEEEDNEEDDDQRREEGFKAAEVKPQNLLDRDPHGEQEEDKQQEENKQQEGDKQQEVAAEDDPSLGSGQHSVQDKTSNQHEPTTGPPGEQQRDNQFQPAQEWETYVRTISTSGDASLNIKATEFDSTLYATEAKEHASNINASNEISKLNIGVVYDQSEKRICSETNYWLLARSFKLNAAKIKLNSTFTKREIQDRIKASRKVDKGTVMFNIMHPTWRPETIVVNVVKNTDTVNFTIVGVFKEMKTTNQKKRAPSTAM